MGTYIPGTPEEQKAMLSELGFESFDELFSEVPEDMKIKGGLDLPDGMSELEVTRTVEKMAHRNKLFPTVFRGAGAYRHFIPAIVKHVMSKEEFITVYTPYQPEISQGILQAIFEYQTMICELTGMDVTNASVYDGATAAAEALVMCIERKRKDIYISETTDPKILEVIGDYCYGNGIEVRMIPEKDGVTDMEALKGALDENTAGVLFQSPNYYGQIEPAAEICAEIHNAGARAIMSVNPISLGLLKTPAELGADIAVGEGQPLGMELSFGGPYLGFMATTTKLQRKMPGKIIGQTADHEGRRAFVLTLQAREQHIRREKASSNICSNQALCAVGASVYLAAMGPSGLNEVAVQCTSKAHYFKDRLAEAGLACKYDGEFFHEFVTVSDTDTASILEALEAEGILGGLPLNDREILWCATEMNTKAEMDAAAEIIASITGKKVNG